MAKATLTAKKRDGSGKGVARALRREGRVPAVLYGRELEPMHLSVDAHEAQKLFQAVSVENTIVDLAVEGEKKAFQTLVREIQTHPWRQALLHVDFLRIQEGVEVDLEVPIHLVGVPVGVRLGGGVLEQLLHDLPIRCEPSKIPEVIELDVSGLELNGALRVGDVPLPEGVSARIPGERTICAVAIPKVVEEAVTTVPTLEGEAAGAAPTEADADKGEKKEE